jgi:hypothetical protein
MGLIVVVAATVEVAPHAGALSHCDFHRIAADQFAGGCGRLLDEVPAMKLAPAARITTGVWRSDLHPSAVWSGEMTSEDGTDPLELELYPGGWGVLRTEFGWFAATHFIESEGLSFDLDASLEVKPNALDSDIVRRAAAILSSDRVWNRTDNRKCPPDATTWSIYCAMEKATIEVTGGFHHRRPALEAVRAIVDQRSEGRNYHHRLMDYNNDPTTHLSDVQSLFREALERTEQGVAQQP